MSDPARFFALWVGVRVPHRRGSPWFCSPPLASPAEARRLAKEKVALGIAVQAHAVVVGPESGVLATYPRQAEAAIGRYNECLDMLDAGALPARE